MEKKEILYRLRDSLLGEEARISLNLDILLDNPRSIPEHINYIEEVETLIGQLADIKDKLDQVDLLLNRVLN